MWQAFYKPKLFMDEKVLFEKVDRALRSDPTDGSLIANTPFSSEEIEYLKEFFRKEVEAQKHSYTGLSAKSMKAFIVAAVNVLRDNDKEWKGGSFWEPLSGILYPDDNSFAEYLHENILSWPNTNDLIDEILAGSGRILFRTPGGLRAFAQTFLFQAMAPRESMRAFIQLAWSVYLGPILEGDYEEDMRLCRYIVDKLAQKFAGSLDDEKAIQFGGAAYGLRRGLRYGIAQNKEKTAFLLNQVFNYIQRADQQNEDLSSTRLGGLVTEVVAKAKETAARRIVRGGHRGERKTAVYEIDKIRPTFYLDLDKKDDPRLLLLFPRLIIAEVEEDYVSATPSFFHLNESGNKIGDPHTFATKLVKKTGEFQILPSFSLDITDLFLKEGADFRFEVFLDFKNGEFYDSEATLCREFLLFRGNQEVRGQCPIGEYYAIVPKGFDPKDCFQLADPSSIVQIRPGIYKFYASEADSISYESTYASFGSPAKNADFFFAKRDLRPHERLSLIKDGVLYRLYKDFSDILIKKDAEMVASPHDYRIHIKNTFVSPDEDPDGNPCTKTEETDNEYRLNDLTEERGYSLLDVETSTQYNNGLHHISIKKLGVYQSKELFALDAVIDKNAGVAINDLAYSFENAKGTVNLLWQTKEYCVTPGQHEVIVPFEGFDAKVSVPYFEWSFASNPEHRHIRESEAIRPLFTDSYTELGVLHTEILSIDTSEELKRVYAEDERGRVEELVATHAETRDFWIGQFLAGHKDYTGTIFAEIGFRGSTRRLKVLTLTSKPYVNQNGELRDQIFLAEDGLHCDFRGFFFHGNKCYRLKLVLTSQKTGKEITLPPFSPDQEFVYHGAEAVDGIYDVDLFYTEYSEADEVFGVPEEKTYVRLSLPEDEVVIGNTDRIMFDENDELDLSKCSTEDGNKKLKGVTIKRPIFVGYGDDNYPSFSGKLRLPDRPKSMDIVFSAKSERLLKSVSIVIHTPNGDVLKSTTLDVQGKTLTDKKASGNAIVEYKTIYLK